MTVCGINPKRVCVCVCSFTLWPVCKQMIVSLVCLLLVFFPSRENMWSWFERNDRREMQRVLPRRRLARPSTAWYRGNTHTLMLSMQQCSGPYFYLTVMRDDEAHERGHTWGHGIHILSLVCFCFNTTALLHSSGSVQRFHRKESPVSGLSNSQVKAVTLRFVGFSGRTERFTLCGSWVTWQEVFLLSYSIRTKPCHWRCLPFTKGKSGFPS